MVESQEARGADQGFLDAHCCSSEECGCGQPRVSPNAPFRVLGYNDLCEDFDIPCFTFGDAVRTFMVHKNDIVCIVGVSEAVKIRLEQM